MIIILKLDIRAMIRTHVKSAFGTFKMLKSVMNWTFFFYFMGEFIFLAPFVIWIDIDYNDDIK